MIKKCWPTFCAKNFIRYRTCYDKQQVCIYLQPSTQQKTSK